jgi:predicted dehydrogenase
MAAPAIPPIRLGLIRTGPAVEKPHWPALRGLTGRYVVTSTPWRQRPQYRGGVHFDAGAHHIAQVRLLRGETARVHGAVQTANNTIDAQSDLTLNVVLTGGAIGNYTASYPEIPMPGQRISSSASFAA